VIDDQAILSSLGHPLRRKILRRSLQSAEAISPDQLANELGERLNDVSYHVRVLKDAGALKLVDTQPVRGVVRHCYRADKGVAELPWVREALGLGPSGGGPS
jgi:DNA-binding transcriptional ArsR family regulator